MKRKFNSATLSIGVLLFVGLTASGLTLASTNNGEIGYIAGANSPIAYVTIVNPPNGYAGCARQNRYIIDISSPGGRSMYAIALTAKAAGRRVTIIGSGACNLIPGDAEDVLNVVADW
jgi:hypothetical protein